MSAKKKKKVVAKRKNKSVPSVKRDKTSAKAGQKLHIVTGDQLMGEYVDKCNELGMTKSEVGRLLVQALVDGDIVITSASV